MTQTILYTCANLAYDQIFSPVVSSPGIEPVLFSDRKPRFVSGWNWRPMPEAAAALGPSLGNRYAKFFPAKIFPEADYSIYIDANLLVIADLNPLLEEFIASGADIGLFPHSARGDIQSELDFCGEVGKIAPADLPLGQAQIDFYRAEGLPRDHVLTENAIILRRHGRGEARGAALDAAMELWWEQLARFTKRDQLSLPYVLHRSGLGVKLWDWNYLSPNPYFSRYIHRRGLLSDIYIFLGNKRHRSAAWRVPVDGAFSLYRGVLKPGLAKLRGGG
ncbi:glycosyltransferase domain-containing protein [Amaricoccus solimangrovi]|uniref:DUF616 domain-containing protein n=1 Tax=Amaricoccus solimangrovi TaxID=2589815 RepID=A0A501W543_9RHOB|nr:glycosyltransferase domain-containing protein [Amaricoccus solimangrovi]TPE45063.1 DUF616 domain-containing protein [Amaricoccus solimangrovi]